jgi:hypothetical protein
MQVAGEHVVPRPRRRVVAQRQAVEDERLVQHLDAEAGRRIAGTVVVVAAHERQLEGGVRDAPAGKRGLRRARLRVRGMQQVAEEDDAARAVARDQRREAIQRLASGAVRHGDAEAAEGLRLADVRIGDEQRRARRPPGGLLGQQVEDCAGDLDGRPGRRGGLRRRRPAQPTSRRSAASRCSVGLRRKPERA